MYFNDLREQLIKVIQKHIPSAVINHDTPEARLNQHRINIGVPNIHKNKRWMMLDVNEGHIHVVMDHKSGDIKENDLLQLDIPQKIEATKGKTRIYLNKNDDAVELYVYDDYIVNFNDDKFMCFLRKYFISYITRVTL